MYQSFKNIITCIALIITAVLFLEINIANAVNIKARINDKVITDYDVQQKIIFLNATQSHRHYSQQDFDEVLEKMIEFLVLEDVVLENKISPSQKEINDAFEIIAHSNNMDTEQFTNVLKNSGISKDAMLENLREQLITQKYVKHFVEPKAHISPAQVQSQKHAVAKEIERQSLRVESVKISEILINKEMLSKTDKPISEYKTYINNELAAGKDFAEIAKAISHSGSAEDGGCLGWMPLDELSNLYQTLVLNLNKGEVSTPYLTEDILIFIKLDDIKSSYRLKSSQVTDEQVKMVLKQQKVDEILQSQLSQLKSKAYIEIKE